MKQSVIHRSLCAGMMVAWLSGCTTPLDSTAPLASTGPLTVTYRTDPAGATLFCDGEDLGTEPVTLDLENYVDTPDKARKYTGKPVTARWPDGCQRTVENAWRISPGEGRKKSETIVPRKILVTYATDPAGGVIYQNGKASGSQILYYISDDDVQKGSYSAPPVTVKWPDGQEKTFPPKEYDVSGFRSSSEPRFCQETLVGPRTVTVTYTTRPSGATLFREGKRLGKAPLSVAYKTETGDCSCPEIAAKWDAGYEQTLPAKTYAVAANREFTETIEAATFDITYTTQPSGGKIISGNQRMLGTAPVTVSYPLFPKHLAENAIEIAPVTVEWADGSRQITLPEKHDLGASRSIDRAVKRTILEVTYRSDPPGATLYEGDEYLGVAPVTLSYPVYEQEVAEGIRRCPNLTARWISGAATTTQENRFNLKGSLSATRSLVRPLDAPDREADIAYSLELERLKLEQERVRLANELEKEKINQDRQIEKDRLAAEQRTTQERLRLEREIESNRRVQAAKQHAAELAQTERERQMRANQYQQTQNAEAANAVLNTGMNLLRLAR